MLDRRLILPLALVWLSVSWPSHHGRSSTTRSWSTDGAGLQHLTCHVGLKSPETVTPVELSSLKLFPSGVTDEGASEMEVMETEFVRDGGRSGRKHREQGKRKE